jgi:hypothetical protein
MNYILEYKNFYKEGDIVIIEYWDNGMMTPVSIVKQSSKRTYEVSHNNKYSEIKNAPNEIIKSSGIIDFYKKLNN